MSINSPSSAQENPVAKTETRRKMFATLVGLDPETATWKDILEADRLQETKKLGIPQNSTWEEIRLAHGRNMDKANGL